MYKTLSSRTILTHPRLTVAEDLVELPDGQSGDYLWFPGNRSGVTLLVRRDDARILIQQEYSYVPRARLYQLPGGGIAEDEVSEIAANRELMEETGLYANRLTRLGSYFVDHRRSTGQMYVFLAEELEERQAPTKDKYEVDLSNSWRSEAQIDWLIRDGQIVNVHLLACWTLYKSAVTG